MRNALVRFLGANHGRRKHIQRVLDGLELPDCLEAL